MRVLPLVSCLGAICLGGCAGSPDAALMEAIRQDEPADVTQAIERGAKINEVREITPEQASVLSHELRRGATPLMIAVDGGDTQAVKTLLEAGADPNGANASGLTALHLSFHRNINVVQTLLKAKADPNAYDSVSGMTPLMQALSGSVRTKEIELLLKRGARPTFVAPNGKSAMDVVNLPSKRERASSNEGLKLLKRRGFKIRLIPPTPDQIKLEKHSRELYEVGLIAHPG